MGVISPLLLELVLILLGDSRQVCDLMFPLGLSLDCALGTGLVRVVLRQCLGQPFSLVGGQVVGINVDDIIQIMLLISELIFA